MEVKHIQQIQMISNMQTVCLLAGRAITSFFKAHLVLLALAASASWFYAGKQYFAKGNLVGALLWETIAVLVLIAFCINTILGPTTSWLSLAIAIVTIGVEVWLVKRWLSDVNFRPGM
jgi:hypothetical protein